MAGRPYRTDRKGSDVFESDYATVLARASFALEYGRMLGFATAIATLHWPKG